MAEPTFLYSDTFDRADTSTGSGLGSTDTGTPLAWSVVSGDFNISGNKAVSTTAIGSNPIAVVDASTVHAVASVDVGAAGDCLYFRVVDADNWWRVRTASVAQTGVTYPIDVGAWGAYSGYSGTSSYNQTGSYNSVHGYPTQERVSYQTSSSSTSYSAGGWSCSIAYRVSSNYGAVESSPHSPSGINQSRRYYVWQTSGGVLGWWRYNCSRSVSGTTSYTYYWPTATRYRSVTQSTSYYTYYTYQTLLEKSVNGTVTSLGTYDGSSPQIKVRCYEDDIEWFRYSGGFVSLGTVTDSTHNTATTYGVGGGTSPTNVTALNNFSVLTLAHPDPPTEPTLVAPSDLAAVATTGPVLFDWTPNDPDVGDSQTAFALVRRKVPQS